MVPSTKLFGPIKIPEDPADERFIYLSDVLPTAWQAVEYADIPPDGSVTVFGLGPIGQMSSRIARYRGARVIAVDLVPERLAMVGRHDIEVLDLREHDDIAATIREMTQGRATDAVIAAIDTVRRGGTLSVIGVYGGMADPLPMLKLFDKQIQIRMGQANVKRWIDDLLPLVSDDRDPLGVGDLATHVMALQEGPQAYKIFQEKRDGAVKVLLKP